MFNQVKVKMQRDYANFYLGQSYMQAFGLLDPALVNSSYEKVVFLKELDAFGFADFLDVGRYWMKQGTLLTFANGNLSKEKALELSNLAKDVFALKTQGLEHIAQIRSVQIKAHQLVRIQVELLNPEDENSASVLFFQDPTFEGTDIKTKMLNELLRDYLDEPTFNNLRTEQQLGYVVFTLLRGFRDVNGIGFLVQSTVQPAAYLSERILDNLDRVRANLTHISQDEFKVKVQATKTRLAVKDTKLEQQNARFWTEIITQRSIFDRQDQNLAMLDTLTSQELIAFFEEKFYTNPRILEVNVVSQKQKENQANILKEKMEPIYKSRNLNVLNVGDQSLTKFKSQMMLHPDPFKNFFGDVRL